MRRYDYKLFSFGYAIFRDTQEKKYVVAKAKKLPNWAKRNDKDFSDYELEGEILFTHVKIKSVLNFCLKCLIIKRCGKYENNT